MPSHSLFLFAPFRVPRYRIDGQQPARLPGAKSGSHTHTAFLLWRALHGLPYPGGSVCCVNPESERARLLCIAVALLKGRLCAHPLGWSNARAHPSTARTQGRARFLRNLYRVDGQQPARLPGAKSGSHTHTA